MYLLGVVIFFARLLDVSLNTLKLKAVMRGTKRIAFVIAFFEVMIYMLAASKAFQYIDNPFVLVMYSLGYAGGNFLGIIIDEKLSHDSVCVMTIINHDGWHLADNLRSMGYAVTSSKGYGLNGSEKVQLYTVIERQNLPLLSNLIKDLDPKAYSVVLEVKGVTRLAVAK